MYDMYLSSFLGNAVSEQAYMLSKHCSSDAFYYIDSDIEDPEAELFIPVLLRKSAVAWNISLLVEVFNDLTFVDEKCTQDFRYFLLLSVKVHTFFFYFLHPLVVFAFLQFVIFNPMTVVYPPNDI